MEQVSDFQRVYDFGNLYAAFLKARKGKRGKPSVAKFEANLLEALSLLSELLKNKTYTMSQYFVFKVYEPKERVVMTNAFKDKLKKQRYLLDSGKITLKQVEQSYGSWRSHAEKGNCYHLIREMDELFMNLFPEIYSKESAA